MKQRIACAALAIAGSAWGQSSISVYGVVDVNVQALDGASRMARVQSGGLGGSRLGFRGQEDLGDGWRAVFALESGSNADDGTIGLGGVFFGRQAHVGLQGPLGQFSLGRQYTSLFAATADFSIFSSTPSGPSTAVLGGFGGYEPVRGASSTATPPAAGATGNGGPVRANNSLRYATPAWHGISGAVLFGAGEIAGATRDARLVDLGLRYHGGAVDAALSFVTDKAVAGSITATDVAITTVAATYTLADWKLAAGFMDLDDKSLRAQDGRGRWFGAQYTRGKHLLKVQWIRNEPRHDREARTSAYGLGWVYEFSRRTALYTSLTRFDNAARAGSDRLGRFNTVVPAGVTVSGDNRIHEFVAGVRHSF